MFSKSCILANCLQQDVLYSHYAYDLWSMLMIFCYFKHYFVLSLMLMNFWQFYLSQIGKGCVLFGPSLFLLCTKDCLSEHSHSYTSLNLFIAWNGWLNFNVPPSISPLRLFQGIICNIERLKGGTLKPWITGGPKLVGSLI